MKDPFHRFKFKIQEKMHNLEQLLSEKEQYENSNEGRDILSKQKTIKSIENMITKIDIEIHPHQIQVLIQI